MRTILLASLITFGSVFYASAQCPTSKELSEKASLQLVLNAGIPMLLNVSTSGGDKILETLTVTESPINDTSTRCQYSHPTGFAVTLDVEKKP